MINQEICRSYFDYADGLVWKVKKGRANIGDKSHKNGNGYQAIKVNNKPYLEHKLVWLWHYGVLPEYIDHIDGNPTNNKIENLRIATHSENMRNAKLRKDSKSQVKGVYWCKSKKKWKAVLTFNGKQHYLGRFIDLELAKKAVNEARLVHHGKFCNYGE